MIILSLFYIKNLPADFGRFTVLKGFFYLLHLNTFLIQNLSFFEGKSEKKLNYVKILCINVRFI